MGLFLYWIQLRKVSLRVFINRILENQKSKRKKTEKSQNRITKDFGTT